VLPHEDIIYLGDTARVPYGTKGPETVVRYALACAKHLVSRKVKAIVIACNTVSAVAPERLRVELDLPILGVIEPGARAAVEASRTGKIGVLATPGTIASGAYIRAIASASTRAEAIGQVAPLLVPLAEEGWVDGPVPELVLDRYLAPLARAKVDVIVLGCTHYPLLRPVIQQKATEHCGPDVTVVDSAAATAQDVVTFLRDRGLENPGRTPGNVELLVTDLPKSFAEQAARFLGGGYTSVAQVDLVP
jgi:glutamate racemase